MVIIHNRKIHWFWIIGEGLIEHILFDTFIHGFKSYLFKYFKAYLRIRTTFSEILGLGHVRDFFPFVYTAKAACSTVYLLPSRISAEIILVRKVVHYICMSAGIRFLFITSAHRVSVFRVVFTLAAVFAAIIEQLVLFTCRLSHQCMSGRYLGTEIVTRTVGLACSLLVAHGLMQFSCIYTCLESENLCLQISRPEEISSILLLNGDQALRVF